MKIMLRYILRPPGENETYISAVDATYDEVMAEIEEHLRDAKDGMTILGNLPSDASKVQFYDVNPEKHRGLMIAWGDNPVVGKVLVDHRPWLRVDGITIEVGHAPEDDERI